MREELLVSDNHTSLSPCGSNTRRLWTADYEAQPSPAGVDPPFAECRGYKKAIALVHGEFTTIRASQGPGACDHHANGQGTGRCTGHLIVRSYAHDLDPEAIIATVPDRA